MERTLAAVDFDIIDVFLDGVTLRALEHACGWMHRTIFKKAFPESPTGIDPGKGYHFHVPAEAAHELSELLEEDVRHFGDSYCGQITVKEAKARWDAAQLRRPTGGEPSRHPPPPPPHAE